MDAGDSEASKKSDEWLVCSRDLEGKMKELQLENKSVALKERSFEAQVLDVLVGLTGIVRCVMKADEWGEDEDVVARERELSDRFRELRLVQLKVRPGSVRETYTERLSIVVTVDNMVRAVMEEWKEHWWENSSLTEHDIFPWKCRPRAEHQEVAGCRQLNE
jgi:hypothetical protein